MTGVGNCQSGGSIDASVTVDVDSGGRVLERLLDIPQECGEVCVDEGECLFIVGLQKQEVTHLGVPGAGAETAFAVHDVGEGAQKGGVVGRAGSSEPNTGTWYYLMWD